MTFRMSDDNVGFAGGTLLAFIPAYHWLWPLQIETIDPTMLVKLWAMKVFGTIILGFLGGLTGMFGKDVYKIIKTKLHEKKNLGSNSGGTNDSSDSIDG
jgi:CDP-diglyceride synthetase